MSPELEHNILNSDITRDITCDRKLNFRITCYIVPVVTHFINSGCYQKNHLKQYTV